MKALLCLVIFSFMSLSFAGPLPEPYQKVKTFLEKGYPVRVTWASIRITKGNSDTPDKFEAATRGGGLLSSAPAYDDKFCDIDSITIKIDDQFIYLRYALYYMSTKEWVKYSVYIPTSTIERITIDDYHAKPMLEIIIKDSDKRWPQ